MSFEKNAHNQSVQFKRFWIWNFDSGSPLGIKRLFSFAFQLPFRSSNFFQKDGSKCAEQTHNKYMSAKENNCPVVDSLLTDRLRLKEGTDTKKQISIYNPYLYTLRINYVLDVDTTLSPLPWLPKYQNPVAQLRIVIKSRIWVITIWSRGHMTQYDSHPRTQTFFLCKREWPQLSQENHWKLLLICSNPDHGSVFSGMLLAFTGKTNARE